jgi:hypothetical protein
MRVATLAVACLMLNVARGSGLDEKLALDLQAAEQSILASLVFEASTGSKYLCATNPYACRGVDPAELGLALIGGSRSELAPKTLVNLVRFRLDAGLAEDFQCYVSFHGKDLDPWIQSANTKKLSEQCHAELAKFEKRSRALYDAGPDLICRTPDEIAFALREVKKVARSGSGCDE